VPQKNGVAGVILAWPGASAEFTFTVKVVGAPQVPFRAVTV
jgi:hypothetical protein